MLYPEQFPTERLPTETMCKLIQMATVSRGESAHGVVLIVCFLIVQLFENGLDNEVVD